MVDFFDFVTALTHTDAGNVNYCTSVMPVCIFVNTYELVSEIVSGKLLKKQLLFAIQTMLASFGILLSHSSARCGMFTLPVPCSVSKAAVAVSSAFNSASKLLTYGR